MSKNVDIAEKSLPKYCLIKEAIKQDILEGKYDGDDKRLPSCRELVEICGASYVTVNKALNLLQDEGYAKMIRGKGIFATRPKRVKSADKANKIGYLMPTQGDLYQNMFSVMLRELEAEDILSVPLYSTSNFGKLLQWEKEEKIDKFTSQGFRSFVVNGHRHFPFAILRKYYERLTHLVFVVHFECGIDFPDANMILADFKKGGHLAADCLLKNGRKKIAFITFELLPETTRLQNGCAEKDNDSDAIEGIKKAFDESGIDFEKNFSLIYDDLDRSENSHVSCELKKFIDSGGDGVICMGDSRALHVYKYAEKNKIKIGKDLGVVGYYNTSWTDVFNPPLTSVSIHEEKIAELAVKAILKKWKGKKIEVEPKLFKRRSE